ncbi:LAQU0S20e00342g1_1 [Lachancea quebecensis]|uniref:LAQU0S20e00342g1_1 n=1 Tax=Lachancea quebecensis TaxID=1654605 RepID=A0A0P1KZ91_9SACH|nr:LAQU0S20e00342g1_1 [Lachancea quebecensis]
MSESGGRRKRGRPPLTKTYANPMDSPMAQTSLKMQKLASAAFSKPLMKVATSEKTTQTPKKYSMSGANVSQTSKRSGVQLSTPVKRTQASRPESSPLTPLDNLFSSGTKAYAFGSSPMGPDYIIETPTKPPSQQLSQFKFSLCIGGDGKAKIADSTSKSKPVRGSLSAGKSTASKFDKKAVLGLLEKMKSSCNEPSHKETNPVQTPKRSMVCPSEVFSELLPSSPKNTLPEQPVMPWTPNCTAIFQLKTGFTPETTETEILGAPAKVLDSQPTRYSHERCRSRSSSSVFKLSSGDPLLMTDDPNTELFAPPQNGGVSTDLFFQQLLASPRRPLPCLNTSPSLTELGSPKHLFRHELQGYPLAIQRMPGHKPVQQKLSHPSTPLVEESNEYSVSIQCTPLIQQTMSGSLNKSFGHCLGQNSMTVAQQPKHLAQDDARLALRKLIGGSK